MLNFVWLALLLLGVLLAGFTGRIPAAVDGALANAREAVTLALGLIGIMTFWLGLMRLAEKSGLVQILARWLRPALARVFPDVPPEHPAMGSMVLNIAANGLGLTNAATPLGLRAMRDLETLNRHPGTATNAMCTFLAINTGSVQLLPVSAIAVLAANGSREPTFIVGTTLLATTCSSAVALGMAKWLQGWRAFALPEGASVSPGSAIGPDSGAPAAAPVPVETPPRLVAWAPVALAGFGLAFAWFLYTVVIQSPAGDPGQPLWMRALNGLSLLAIPFLAGFFPLYAALARLPVYEEFIEGAREGFQTAVRIIPYLVAMLVAIGLFRGAGGIEALTRILGPALARIRFPPELLPMALLRPLTGSGTLAALGDLVKTHGPDSLLARAGATLFGSTETTFYVLAVYFGAVGIRRTRHAVWCGLAAD
ncbi:MAG: nucleoside recognition domain-containing protein, partial [Verrucomicrobiota bacterium]